MSSIGPDIVARASYLDWSSEGRPGLARYLAGAALSLICFFLLGGLAILPLAILVPNFTGSPVLSVLSKLLTFVIPFFTIPFIVRLIHGRPAWSVAMPRPWFGLTDLVTGIWIGALVGIAATLLGHFTKILPISPNPQFSLGALLPLILTGFVGIFVQSGAEELLFRGYFMQFVRSFTANRYAVVGIPAVLFAVPHIGNIAALGGRWVAVAPYLIQGILFGWAAYQTGSLWMPVGLHLINNYTSLVLLGAKGDVLSGTAPFLVEASDLATITALTALQAVWTSLILARLRPVQPQDGHTVGGSLVPEN